MRGPWQAAPGQPAPEYPGPSLATPLSWIGGTLLLTGTTFLVSLVALVRAVGSLFD